MVSEVNASALGRVLELLGANGRSWLMSELLVTDDPARWWILRSCEDQCQSLAHCVRGGSCLQVNVSKSRGMNSSKNLNVSRIGFLLN